MRPLIRHKLERDAMALGTSKIFVKVVMVAALLAVLLLTASWVFYADDRLPSHSARIGTLCASICRRAAAPAPRS